MERLQGFRVLTDEEAIELVESGGLIDVQVEWAVARTRSGRAYEVRTSVPVNAPSGERLKIAFRIELDKPWQSHLQLIWGDKRHREHPETIRRLDLRDDHRNPDGEVWDRRTHKHTWSCLGGNGWAYTPNDIPHDPSVPPVTPDDYREVFEAFADEVNVYIGARYEWNDPPLDQIEAAEVTAWEAP